MECKGCTTGIKMCYHRPCMGTPEEFEAIIDAGFGDKLRIDFWYGHHDIEPITPEQIEAMEDPLQKALLIFAFTLQMKNGENPHKDNVEFLSGGTPTDINFYAQTPPTGRCNLLTKDNLCSLHELGLKPEQGKDSCCKGDEAKHNLHYVNQWASENGKRVIDKFKKVVNYGTL